MLYSEYVRNDKKEELSLLLSKLEEIQVKNAGTVLPSPTHMKAEILYNRLHIFSILFKLCLTLGCAGILLFIICTVREREMNRIQRVFYPLLILVFIIATAGLCLRGYIGGRLPMSNGYETMLFIAWCSLLTGILARKYSFLILNFSFLLSGFTLLVAHIGSMNPQITPLVPVLQSPLLSIHVSLIMISYGLCGFMLFNSLTSLILLALPGNQIRKRKQTELLKEMSELLMYPATFLMGAGIFVGAIWANVSWGRYWGWDPKEVWALITFLLMSFTFHGKTITWFQRPVVYHLFVIIIFISVLMTYFGVNYILGGKHSYGGA
jgi:ABC-type transport system involved in cytochrome c biogenesis permease subunit